jgi:hypothetical protein
MNKFLLTTSLHPIEGLFWGAGKAGVVVGVAAMILVGLLWWMYRSHKQLADMERRIEAMESTPSRPSAAPITPQRK